MRIIGLPEAFAAMLQLSRRAFKYGVSVLRSAECCRSSTLLARQKRTARLGAGVQCIVAAQQAGAAAGVKCRLRSSTDGRVSGDKMLAEARHQKVAKGGRHATA